MLQPRFQRLTSSVFEKQKISLDLQKNASFLSPELIDIFFTIRCYRVSAAFSLTGTHLCDDPYLLEIYMVPIEDN